MKYVGKVNSEVFMRLKKSTFGTPSFFFLFIFLIICCIKILIYFRFILLSLFFVYSLNSELSIMLSFVSV